MSEEKGLKTPENSGSGSTEAPPVPASNKGLTISRKRLAGSTNCLNCGTHLQGPFCHYCGQPDKNLVRFFPALLREMLEDFADFDSRFMRTLKPLLLKPGKLTRDYLDGRRFRYVPPLRLYIFSSILLFFLLALLAGSALTLQTEPDGEAGNVRVELSDGDREDLNEALQELDQVRPGLSDLVSSQVEEAEQDPDAATDETGKLDFDWNGKPWDQETNPVDFALMPTWATRLLNREIAESPQKGEAIERNPNLIMDKVLDVLPGTMFVLLPIVALLLKFWYLFARRYYVEHLIFALHNHAFIFVVFIVMLLTSTLAEWREPSGAGVLTSAADWVRTILVIWIPIYLLVSMKRVYQQGWGLTVAKYFAVGISYLMTLGLATGFVALAAFIML
jgi:hypothetical protein